MKTDLAAVYPLKSNPWASAATKTHPNYLTLKKSVYPAFILQHFQEIHALDL